MGNNTPKKIRESREKILLLMEKGYNQLDIAKELQITRMTINRDMHYINEMTNKLRCIQTATMDSTKSRRNTERSNVT
jgi:DNA-binding NarL/FixJ family response regulator